MCKSSPMAPSDAAVLPGFFSLFKGVRRRFSSGNEMSTKSGESSQPTQELTERAYDMAEVLEAGFARELTGDLQHPLRRAERLWKFKVVRDEDRLQFRLFSEAGDFLLYARANLERQFVTFHSYDPTDCEQGAIFDVDRPAFSMSYNRTKTDWRLVEERCGHCVFQPESRSCQCKRELARIQQKQTEIGDGVFYCMDIDAVPLRADGCGPVPPACTGEPQPQPQRLVTRAPKWNDELGSLVMDFKGRKVKSSAKNFQLTPEERPDHIVCQYAKFSANVFSLDFRHPMSVIQAFAISLTTLMWT